MRDNRRRSRARQQALTQGYPGEPSGRLAQPLTPLAACLRGRVGSQRRPLPRPPGAATAGREGGTMTPCWRQGLASRLPPCSCLPGPARRACGAWRAAAWAGGVVRCGGPCALRGVPCRWPGGCARAPRGLVPRTSPAPWWSWGALCSRRGRTWGAWARARAPGASGQRRGTRRAGGRPAARPRATRRRGQTRRCPATRGGRVASRGGGASARQGPGPARRLVRCGGGVGGRRGMPSRCLGSGRGLQRRRQASMRSSVAAARPCFQLRKVAGARVSHRIAQTLRVCLGYESRPVWPP
jgi:hypothetical protein